MSSYPRATPARSRRKRTEPVKLHPIPAAADLLNCSAMHVYRLVASGVLRAVDISQPGAKKAKTRIRSDDLLDYIEARTRTAATGPAA